MEKWWLSSLRNFVFIGLFISCHLNWQRADLPKLELLATHSMAVPEPSGLLCHPHTGNLWTVSDNNGDLYEILPKGGAVLQRLKTSVDDAEGLGYHPEGGGFIVADEAHSALAYYSIEGDKEKVISLGDIAGLGSKHGLEGLCYVPNTHTYAALAEKYPGMLLQFSGEVQQIKTTHLDFAADYSGLTFDKRYNAFWILSDESATVTLYHPEKGTLAQYRLPAQKAEGIAINNQKNRLYIVYDNTAALQVFKLPQMKSISENKRK